MYYYLLNKIETNNFSCKLSSKLHIINLYENTILKQMVFIQYKKPIQF